MAPTPFANCADVRDDFGDGSPCPEVPNEAVSSWDG